MAENLSGAPFAELNNARTSPRKLQYTGKTIAGVAITTPLRVGEIVAIDATKTIAEWATKRAIYVTVPEAGNQAFPKFLVTQIGEGSLGGEIEGVLETFFGEAYIPDSTAAGAVLAAGASPILVADPGIGSRAAITRACARTYEANASGAAALRKVMFNGLGFI